MALRKLAAGVFVDDEGTLHLDLPEICTAAGYEPTQANQDMVQGVALSMFAEAEFEEVPDGGRGSWRAGDVVVAPDDYANGGDGG